MKKFRKYGKKKYSVKKYKFGVRFTGKGRRIKRYPVARGGIRL